MRFQPVVILQERTILLITLFRAHRQKQAVKNVEMTSQQPKK
jgi:hypothetical protein